MSRKSSETRKRILDTAWKLLEAGQGKEVAMADFAAAAKISRQALYLHFPKRVDLLIATARYVDEAHNIDDRLAASRNAPNGSARLEAYVLAWGNYIPEIYGIGKALLVLKESDEAAAIAWNDRMQAVRHGCAAVVRELKAEGRLMDDYSVRQATDIMWTLLSVRNWEQFVLTCGWSQKRYIETLCEIIKQSIVLK